jgi:hypothetical protein
VNTHLNNDQTNTWTGFHGTAVASVAVGTWLGVAKEARLGLIQVTDTDGSSDLSGAIKAIDHILSHSHQDNANTRGRAVIGMSFSTFFKDAPWWPNPTVPHPRTGTLQDVVDVWKLKLDDAYRAGIAAAASAGNTARDPDPNYRDLYFLSPRRSGGADSPLIVVGSNNINNARSAFSNHIDSSTRDILSLYAIGEDYITASSEFDNEYKGRMQGTSYATALTVGVMANMLADPVLRRQFNEGGAQNMPMRLKQYILERSAALKGVHQDILDGKPRLSNDAQVPCDENPEDDPAPVTGNPNAIVWNVFEDIAQGMSMAYPAAKLVSLPGSLTRSETMHLGVALK